MRLLCWFARLLKKRGERRVRGEPVAPSAEDWKYAEDVLNRIESDDRFSQLEARVEGLRREVEALRKRLRDGRD
ncbi:MAG: hypothetical protein NZ938_04070 [Aigarchaeota archaeon]|nr:hypothetical protein [Candidatus Calditenuaceae archaeon]